MALENDSINNLYERNSLLRGIRMLPAALESGMDMKTASGILGHGGIQVTIDVYSHAMKSKKQAGIQLSDENGKIS